MEKYELNTYLAGPIDGADIDNAKEWREWLTEQLAPMGIGTLNPFGQFGGDRLAEVRKDLHEWNVRGQVDNIREFVSKVVMPPDLDMVEKCDFVTLHIPKLTSEVCGSYGEATLAFYLNIPVYIVTTRCLRPVTLPNWIIGCSDKIFSSWADYLYFIGDKYIE